MNRASASAKINLALVVGPVRDDGYHEVATVLQRINFADRVEVEPADDGAARLVVSTANGVPAPAALAAAIVGRGWGLVELRPLTMTLEDLYVRLIATAQDAPAA